MLVADVAVDLRARHQRRHRVDHHHVDATAADEDLGDMTGLELVRRILKINFMINFAVVSGLSADEFHEASEGLGVMTQLPQRPGKKDADGMIKTLKQIKGL